MNSLDFPGFHYDFTWDFTYDFIRFHWISLDFTISKISNHWSFPPWHRAAAACGGLRQLHRAREGRRLRRGGPRAMVRGIRARGPVASVVTSPVGHGGGWWC